MNEKKEVKFHYFKIMLLVLLFGTNNIQNVLAQNISDIYNPNLFLGTVDVQIPIYDQNGIGVSLSYNTKGVPVREMAGVAGLHWNLNCGGAIYRKVKGIPDEFKYNFQSDPNNPSFFWLDTINDSFFYKFLTYKGRLYEPLETLSEKGNQTIFRDTESDEFTFSVGQKFFKFYMGRNGDIFTNPDGKYDILFFRDGAYRKANDQSSLADYPGLFQALLIKIIDRSDMSSYYFSPNQAPKLPALMPYFVDYNDQSIYENSYGSNPYSSKVEITNSWKLDSIVQNNLITKLTYKEFNWNYNHGAIDSSWVVREDGTLPFVTVKSGKDNGSKFFELDTIKYPDGTILSLDYGGKGSEERIDFSDNYDLPFLKNIIINKGVNAIKYKFDYNYFYSSGSEANNFEPSASEMNDSRDKYSLKLKSISRSDADETLVDTIYKFGYKNKKQRRFGKGLDYYGYYNGGNALLNNTEHSIKKQNISNSYTTKSNDTSAFWGLLNTIENKYGGKVEFKYGLHKNLDTFNCIFNSSDNRREGFLVADGVRIDSIITTDKYAPLKRDVTYFEFGNCHLFYPGGFTMNYFNPDVYPNNKNAKLISETFVNPFLYNGNNHGYSNVTVLNKNKDNQMLGKTVYEFTNLLDENGNCRVTIAGGGKHKIEPPFIEKQYIRDWELGLPLSVKEYDEKGLIITETKNEYLFVLDTLSAIQKQVLEKSRNVLYKTDKIQNENFHDFSENVAVYDILEFEDPYYPYRGKSLLSKSITYKYESDIRKIADSITYQYDNRNNQKRTFTTNSKGETVVNEYIYNYDLGLNTISSQSVLNQLNIDDRELLIGTERWKRPLNSSNTVKYLEANDLVLDASIFKYTLLPNGNLISKEVYALETEEPISGAIYREGIYNPNPLSGPTYKPYQQVAKVWKNETLPLYLTKKTEAQIFDNNGFVVQAYIPETDVYKVNLFHKTNFNKIVDVVNAKLNEVGFADFDNDIDGNIIYEKSNVFIPNSNIATSVNPILVNQVITKTISGNGVLAIEASTANTKKIYIQGLTDNKDYRATFWATANAIPQFGIEGGAQYTLTEIAARGGFKQYEVIFKVESGHQNDKVGINSPNANIGIEDVRICPVNAVMQNWTYEPLFGIKSVTNALGKVTYQEYDKLGRPTLTRDQDDNILEKKEYGKIY